MPDPANKPDMDASVVDTVEGLDADSRARLSYLYKMQGDITEKIHQFFRDLAPASDRPIYTCLRCGHQWRARMRTDGQKPRVCARCHSGYWDKPPQRSHARRPGDPPPPRLTHWGRAPKDTKPKPKVESEVKIEPVLRSFPAGLTPPPGLSAPLSLAERVRQSLSPPPGLAPPQVASTSTQVVAEQPEHAIVWKPDHRHDQLSPEWEYESWCAEQGPLTYE